MALKEAIMAADIYAQREEIRLDERQLSRAPGVSRTPILRRTSTSTAIFLIETETVRAQRFCTDCQPNRPLMQRWPFVTS
jgi:hypothetical protein